MKSAVDITCQAAVLYYTGSVLLPLLWVAYVLSSPCVDTSGARLCGSAFIYELSWHRTPPRICDCVPCYAPHERCHATPCMPHTRHAFECYSLGWRQQEFTASNTSQLVARFLAVTTSRAEVRTCSYAHLCVLCYCICPCTSSLLLVRFTLISHVGLGHVACTKHGPLHYRAICSTHNIHASGVVEPRIRTGHVLNINSHWWRDACVGVQ